MYDTSIVDPNIWNCRVPRWCSSLCCRLIDRRPRLEAPLLLLRVLPQFDDDADDADDDGDDHRDDDGGGDAGLLLVVLLLGCGGKKEAL